MLMQAGELLGFLVANELIKLEETADEILRASNEEVAEGEDTPLVDSGNAAKVRMHALREIRMHRWCCVGVAIFFRITKRGVLHP